QRVVVLGQLGLVGLLAQRPLGLRNALGAGPRTAVGLAHAHRAAGPVAGALLLGLVRGGIVGIAVVVRADALLLVPLAPVAGHRAATASVHRGRAEAIFDRVQFLVGGGVPHPPLRLRCRGP